MSEIRKCAACGAVLSSFEAVCPECGAEVTEVKNSESVQQFAERLSKLDEKIYDDGDFNGSTGVGVWTVVLWIFFFPIMMALFIIKKSANATKALEGAEKQKANFIAGYPIPNSCNDLLEFSILCRSQLKSLTIINALTNSASDIQAWNKIWINKLVQVGKKANISLSGDSGALSQVNSQINEAKEIQAQNNKLQYICMGALCVVFVLIIVFASI